MINTTFSKLNKRYSRLFSQAFAIFITLSVSLFCHAEAEGENEKAKAYVSEKLTIFVHKGSSRKFKIIGSLTAGDKFDVLEHNDETKFTQIKDKRGRVGWIEDQYISQTVSEKDSLNTKIESLNQQLSDISQISNQQQETIASFEDVKTQLENQLLQTQAQIDDKEKLLSASQEQLNTISTTINEKQFKLKWKYFSYGAATLLGGIIIGLILPHLFGRRRGSSWD